MFLNSEMILFATGPLLESANLYSCHNFELALHENALVFSQAGARNIFVYIIKDISGSMDNWSNSGKLGFLAFNGAIWGCLKTNSQRVLFRVNKKKTKKTGRGKNNEIIL